MPATPKSSRTNPPRYTENYVLTYVRDAEDCGLYRCPDEKFTTLSSTAVGSWDNSSYISDFADIKFQCSINDVKYKFFNVVSGSASQIVLHDVDVDSTNDLVLTAWCPTNSPTRMKLVAPSLDIVNNTTMWLSSNKIERIKIGMEPPPEYVNARLGSKVQKFFVHEDHNGKKLIVRSNNVWYVGWDANGIDRYNVLRSDIVVYENGKVEFRYAPSYGTISPDYFNANSSALSDDAYVGIALSSTPTPSNRTFRDFGIELGKDTISSIKRTRYVYGGVGVDNPSDPNATATIKLNSTQYWPGGRTGGKFVFQPPLARRKILPRVMNKKHDAIITLPQSSHNLEPLSNFGPFDDRRSVIFGTNSAANFPTTLSRFGFGTNEDVTNNQDLFTGDFEFESQISRDSVDTFVVNPTQKYIKPFSETSLPEQGRATNDQFFMTGSYIEDSGFSFDSPLKSKTQIKLSLPIDFSVAMISGSSSFYYYNKKSKSWNVPLNSSCVLSGSLASTIVQNAPYKSDIKNPRSQIVSNVPVVEDRIGFGAIGNFIVSGSRDSTGLTTNPNIGTPFISYNGDLLIDSYDLLNMLALPSTYEKTITVNQDYEATKNELIDLPITKPFLLEKASIEIPLATGNGWFNDLTYVESPFLIAGKKCYNDLGGPGITVALFNQLTAPTRLSANMPLVNTYREIILTGTITHAYDNVSHIADTTYEKSYRLEVGNIGVKSYVARQTGFLAFGAKPTFVVSPNSINQFTGTVQLNCASQISNGVQYSFLVQPDNSAKNANFVKKFCSYESLIDAIGSAKGYVFASQPNVIGTLDNVGRGGVGQGSNRSIFGHEYFINNEINAIANPFYKTASLSLPTFTSPGALNPIFGYASSLVNANSPYLLLPGDKLALSISKTRPAFYTLNQWASGTIATGEIKHDVQLITGTINITLYGSMITDDHEYHDTLTQPLCSNAIHEVIGTEPVLDQFEVESLFAYTGSYCDNFVTGTMIDVVNTQRSLVFNRVDQLYQPNDRLTSAEDVKSKQLHLKKEYSGDVRLAPKHIAADERYYDSITPDIPTLLKACNDPVGVRFFPEAKCGVISLSYQRVQGDFFKSFPFESKYSRAIRNIITKFFCEFTNAGAIYNGFVDRLLVVVEVGSTNVSFSSFGYFFNDAKNYRSFIDPGIGMSLNDAMQVLFGYGDINLWNVVPKLVPGEVTKGLENLPDARYQYNNLMDATWEVYSPIIRGWKYGLYSGLASYSSCQFRRNHFGYLRDMLEQRQFTRFQYTTKDSDKSSTTLSDGPVTIQFIDPVSNTVTKPEKTWSQNLDTYATSSVPYFDGDVRDRTVDNNNAIDTTLLNLGASSFIVS